MTTPKNPQNTATSLDDKARLLKAREQPLGQQGNADENAPVGWDTPRDGPRAGSDATTPVVGGHPDALPASGAADIGAPAAAVPLGTVTPGPSAPVGGGGGAAGMQATGPLVGPAIAMPNVESRAYTPSTATGDPVPHVPHGSAGGGAAPVQALPGDHVMPASQQATPVPQVTPVIPVAQVPPGQQVHGPAVAAVIGGIDTATVTEDTAVQSGQLQAAGQLTVTDPDAGEAHFQAQSAVSGQYGSFALATDGSWTYIADNSQAAIQSLKAGATLTDSFTVTSADGTTHTVTVTLTGTNDTPALQAQSQSVTEDGSQLTGQMHATDVDTGDTQAFSTAATVAGFTLNADGSYSFDPADAAYQHLAAGQTQDVVIPVTVTDSAGATSSQNLVITVTGGNDGAVITGQDTGAVREDVNTVGSPARIQVTGKLDVADVDTGENAFTFHGPFRGAIQGQYGTLGIKTDGAWEYHASNAALQNLREGQQVTDTITVTSKDGTAHNIVITITGTNDAPTVSHAVTRQSATEDAAFSFAVPSGTFADIDTGDTLILSTGTLPAWLHFDAATGTFSGTPANGDVGTTQVTVTATDGSGATVSTIFDLVVTNTNDAPTLNPISTVHTTEDGAQATGQFTATDPDTGDTLTYSIASAVDGLTVNADGSWSFDPGHAAYQHLAAGQTQDVVIPVTVTDSAGATSTQNLTITVTGTNDGAVIAGTDTGGVTEDTSLHTSGQLTVTDVDDGQAHFTAQPSVVGTYGSFTLAADGSWTYALDNANAAVNALQKGNSLTDSLSVQSTDGTTHTVTVTIAGTNDVPNLLVRSHAVVEDGSRITGQVHIDDPDTGDTHTVSTTATIAGFTLNADGSYSFDPGDAAYQHLAQGQKLTLNIPITVTDSQGAHTMQPLIIGLTGSNDGAVIAGTDRGAVTEDTQVSTRGQLTVTDIDDQQAAFQAQGATHGTYGSFTLAADGSWTYTLDNANAAVQGLKAGDTLTDTFTVQSVDGTTHQVSLTINGHGDAAVIAGIDTATVTEDQTVSSTGKIEANGQLTVTDVDTGEAVFQAQANTAGQYGSFTLAADGSWTYSADNSQAAVQSLKAGATLTDTLTVASADGTSHTVTVTITGTNDAPSLLVRTHAVAEDGSQVTGKVRVNDVDAGDTHTFSLAHPVAGFTLNADGSYSFDPSDAAYQHLAQGQRLNIGIDITVTDSAGAHDTQPLFITVTGTNDGAVITGGGGTVQHTDGAVTEDTGVIGGKLTASGTLTVTDVDSGEAHFVAQTDVVGSSGYGHFSIDASGHWTYEADNASAAIQGLKVGDRVIDSITVATADGTQKTITVALTGTDDQAVISGTDTGAVTEDHVAGGGHSLLATGMLAVADADAGQSVFQAMDATGQFGRLFLHKDGGWQYQADNNNPAVQALKAGEHATDSFTVHSADGTAHTVTVTLNGTNDAPVLQAQTQAVTEDGTQLTGHMTATDVDTGDTQTFSIAQPVDGFTLNPDGSYSFDPSDAAYQQLGAGQHQTLTIPVTVTDSAGATSIANLVINITGTNDGPRMVTAPITVAEGASAVSGQLQLVDPDSGDSVSCKLASPVDGMLLNPDGTYTFDPAHAAYNHLAVGQQQVVSVPVVVTDGHGTSTTQTLQITVTGTNDGPRLTAAPQTVAEGAAKISGQLAGTDPDTADTLTYSTTATVAGFTLNGNGSYSFDPANAAYDHIGKGQTETLRIPVQVADPHGGTAAQTLVITITGTNNGPHLNAAAQTATEDGALVRGQLTATDPDTADVLTYKLAAPVAGLNLNPDGSYTFDPGHGAYDFIASGQQHVLSIPVVVTDGHGGTDTQNLQITVTGVDDAPHVLVVAASSVAEGAAPLNGQLTATDPDTGDTLTFSSAAHIAGFTIQPDGHYSFNPDDAAYNSLGVGHSQLVSIPVTVTDSQGQTDTQTIHITVTGTNDQPVMTAEPARVTDAGTPVVHAQLVATDPDIGDTLTFRCANPPTGFNLNPDGSYTFDPNAAPYKALGDGQQQSLSITVTVTDGHGGSDTQVLHIQVTGTNDAPVLSIAPRSVAEDAPALTGQLAATDPDAGDTLTFSTSAQIAGFTLNADGSYSFDPSNAAYQSLGVGHNQVLSIPVAVTDSHGASVTQNLQITVTGTNDVPQLTIAPQSATEDGAVVTGRLAATDPDVGDTLRYSTTATVPGFSLNPDGSYRFDPANAAYDDIPAGQHRDVQIPIAVNDGHGGTTTQSLTITVTGINDQAIITGGVVSGQNTDGAVTEDTGVVSGKLTASGTLTVTDVDSGEAHFVAQTDVPGSRGYGHFSIDASGHWTYQADNASAAIQGLMAGERALESFTVATADGTQQTITVALTGTNDQAVITGIDTGTVTEDRDVHGHLLQATGTLAVSDADAGQSVFQGTDTPGQFGHLVLQKDGSWQYLADNTNPVVQALKAGASLTDSFTVHSADGTAHTVTVTIQGTNDAPVLQAQSQSVTEDGQQLSGQMVATDIDTGDTLTYSTAASIDGFTLNPDGSYSFNPGDAAYQHLTAGQVQTLTIPVTVTDSAGATSSQNLVIELTGTNDAAKITGTDTGQVIEDFNAHPLTNALYCSGRLAVSDVDTGQNHFSFQSGPGSAGLGSFMVRPDGSWGYTVDNNAPGVQSIGEGMAAVDKFTVRSADGTEHTITVTILGRNDAPVVSHAQTTVTWPEDQHFSFSLAHDTFADIDSGDTSRLTVTTGTLPAWLHFDPATYTFSGTPGNADVGTQQITVTATDSHGAKVDMTFELVVNNTNDPPTLNPISTVHTTEDGTQASGHFTATDPDTGDTLTYSTTATIDGLTVNADGSWHFDPSHASYQSLAAGQVQTLTIPVTVTDAAGATSSQNLVIRLSGTNDGAQISGTDVGAVTEDQHIHLGLLVASGHLAINDVDQGEAHFSAQSGVSGSSGLGHFAVDAQGSWEYTADNANPAVQALKAGEQVTDSLTVHSADGTAHTITVTLTGTNDGAVITGTDHGDVTEDVAVDIVGRIAASGVLSVSDPDAGESVFAVQHGPSAQGYGNFLLGPSGHWTYSADNANPAIQALKAGETLSDSFVVHSVDGTTHTVSVTIHGSNDAPTVAHALTTSTAAENAAFSFAIPSGTFADIDNGDTLTLSTGTLPAWLHFDAATGTFSGTPANGDAGTTQVTVIATDGSGAKASTTFDLVVNNTNDAPTLNWISSVRVTEDGAQATGQFTATDPDTGDTLTYSTTATIDGLTVNADGSWNFDPSHASYQSLAAGQVQTLTIPVTVTDSAGATGSQNLVIYLVGTNDGAQISGTDVGAVTEDQHIHLGLLVASGHLAINDVDQGEAHFSAQSGVTGSSGLGHFAVDAQGSWEYTADNANPAVQALKAGEQVTDSLTVHSADGTTHTITVTLTGTNDGAVITGTDHGDVTEDVAVDSGGRIGTSGVLSVSDPDAGESVFAAQGGPSAQGYGVFALGPSGHWTYTADNDNPAIQALKAGETLSDSFTVHSADGTSHTVSFTIHGTNDAPGIGATHASARFISEDSATTSITGHLLSHDADAGDTLTWSVSGQGQGTYGHLDFDPASGNWTYRIDNADADTNALAAGQRGEDVFQITATDGSGATASTVVRVIVMGANDGAVIAGTDTGMVTEDSQVTGGKIATSGQLTVTDVDAGEAVFTAQPDVAGNYGHFGIDAQGHWTYSADNTNPAIQQLKAGATLTDSFTVTSADGTTHTVTVTVAGTNDAPSLLVRSHAVAEDGARVTGNARVDDVDAGDTHTFSLAHPVAGFTLNPDGSYSFDPSDAAYQHLALGQRLNLGIDITVTDGSGAKDTQPLFITITGTNDGAVVSGVDSGTVGEDARLTAGGKLTVADVDDNQAVFTAQNNVAGTYGSFSLATDGTWAYTLDNTKTEVQALKTGETRTENFVVTSADGTTHTVTLTVVGSDDAARIGGVDTGAVSEDGILNASGQLSITDPDAGQAAFMARPRTPGQHGVFTFAADGHWTYALNNSDTDVQSLVTGRSLTDSLTVRSVDGSTHTITVTIQGREDVAVITGVDTGRVTEDRNLVAGQLQTQGQLSLIDADTGQAHFLAQSQVAGQYGTFSVNIYGLWTYTADNRQAAVQGLKGGDTLTDSFTVRSADGTSHNVTVTINGTNDVPNLLVRSHAVLEDGSRITGQVRIDDPDTGDTHVVSTTATVAGFTLNPDGSYSFDPGDAAYQHLAQGQRLTLNIPITVTDSQGAHSTQPLTIVLTGSNDGALIAGTDRGAVTEDGRTTASGRLTVVDPDAGEAVFTAQANAAGSYGSFTLAANGSWTYTLDNTDPAVQALNAGQTLTDRLTVRSADGTTHSLSIVINGADDGAHLIAQSKSINEDGSSLSGHLQLSGGAGTSGYTFSVANPIPGLQIDPDGSYFFSTRYPEYQHLRDGQQLIKDIPITITDSQGHAVTEVGLKLTIVGANDRATITGDDYETLTEDKNVQTGHLQASGLLRIDDIDLGEAHFVAQQGLHGQYGTLDIDTQGHWTYSADNNQSAIQNLNSGQSLTDRVTVRSADGTQHDIVIAIRGQDEPVTPTLQGPALIVAPPSNHVLQPSMVQSGDFYQQLIDTFLATHDPAYVAAAHAMQNGDPYGTLGNVELVIDGAGILISDHSGSVSTKIRPNASGTAAIPLTALINLHVNQGTWVQLFDPQNPWHEVKPWLHDFYDDDHLRVDYLGHSYVNNNAQGTVSQPISVPFYAPPGGGYPAPAPMAPGAPTHPQGDTATTDEDTAVSGLLSIHHADGTAAHFNAQTDHDGQYGKFSIDDQGHWSYTPDDRADALNDGDTAQDVFKVTLADGTTHDVAITLTGTSDTPIVAPPPPAPLAPGMEAHDAPDIAPDAPVPDAAEVAAPPALPETSPLHDYLQFADTSGHLDAGQAAQNHDLSPLDDYLVAAGVSHDVVTAPQVDLPPTDVLIDLAHPADPTAAPEVAPVDDAALAALPVEVPHTPQDDPQHHGV